MIATFIAGASVGAIVFALVLRNNPKIAKKFYSTADWIEVKIENKTGKDI